MRGRSRGTSRPRRWAIGPGHVATAGVRPLRIAFSTRQPQRPVAQYPSRLPVFLAIPTTAPIPPHPGCAMHRTILALLLSTPAFAVEPVAPVDWGKHPENTWVRQSPREGATVPSFLYEGSGDYDPFSRKWVHHAGH